MTSISTFEYYRITRISNNHFQWGLGFFCNCAGKTAHLLNWLKNRRECRSKNIWIVVFDCRVLVGDPPRHPWAVWSAEQLKASCPPRLWLLHQHLRARGNDPQVVSQRQNHLPVDTTSPASSEYYVCQIPLSCPDIPSYSWFMVLLIYSSVWALVTESLSPLVHIFTSSFSLSTAWMCDHSLKTCVVECFKTQCRHV